MKLKDWEKDTIRLSIAYLGVILISLDFMFWNITGNIIYNFNAYTSSLSTVKQIGLGLLIAAVILTILISYFESKRKRNI